MFIVFTGFLIIKKPHFLPSVNQLSVITCQFEIYKDILGLA